MLFRFWVFPDCTFLDISIMNQDTMHDYTQLMKGSVWNEEVVCSPEIVISFLNDSGTFQSFGGGLICTITQKMPNLAGCTPKEITKNVYLTGGVSLRWRL